jgi:hypothetical protein
MFFLYHIMKNFVQLYFLNFLNLSYINNSFFFHLTNKSKYINIIFFYYHEFTIHFENKNNLSSNLLAKFSLI